MQLLLAHTPFLVRENQPTRRHIYPKWDGEIHMQMGVEHGCTFAPLIPLHLHVENLARARDTVKCLGLFFFNVASFWMESQLRKAGAKVQKWDDHFHTSDKCFS